MGRRCIATSCTLALVALALVLVPAGRVDSAPAEPLRLNHFQAKGSHNSYHIEQPPETIDLYYDAAPELEPWLLAYTHPPLADQLDLGFRQFELDAFPDPTGALYEPNVPGFKVRHIEVVDEDTQCALLTDCLTDLEAWSDDHPGHLPLTVLIELKHRQPFFPPDVPVTPADLHDLDDEIRSVLDPDQLVTPDYVRGVGRPGGADGEGTVYPDVESAILDEGWPLLEDVRDKFLIVLDNERDDYVDGDPTLAGRVAFPPSTPGAPDAAFVKRNDPEGTNTAEIQDLVEQGYVVRTRSDLPVETGLTGDGSRQVAALASGAHWTSGDYLYPDDYARYDAAFAARFDPPLTFDPTRPAYQTVMPGGTPARCNPISAPPGCTSTDIENLGAVPPTDDPDALPDATPDDASTGIPSSPGAVATPAEAARPVRQSPAFTG